MAPQKCSPGLDAAAPPGFVPGRCQVQRVVAQQLVKVGAQPEKTGGVCFRKRLLELSSRCLCWTPELGGALIPLDVGCHAIIFEKALSTPEETSFFQ